MKVGQIIKLKRSLNLMFKTTIGAFKKGSEFLVLNVSTSRGSPNIGATKLQHVKSGQIYDIDDFFGYWCFLNSGDNTNFEYEIVGFAHLMHVIGFVKAIELNLNDQDHLDLIVNPNIDNIQKMLFAVNNARRNLDDLESLLTKELSNLQ